MSKKLQVPQEPQVAVHDDWSWWTVEWCIEYHPLKEACPCREMTKD